MEWGKDGRQKKRQKKTNTKGTKNIIYLLEYYDIDFSRLDYIGLKFLEFHKHNNYIDSLIFNICDKKTKEIFSTLLLFGKFNYDKMCLISI